MGRNEDGRFNLTETGLRKQNRAKHWEQSGVWFSAQCPADPLLYFYFYFILRLFPSIRDKAEDVLSWMACSGRCQVSGIWNLACRPERYASPWQTANRSASYFPFHRIISTIGCMRSIPLLLVLSLSLNAEQTPGGIHLPFVPAGELWLYSSISLASVEEIRVVNALPGKICSRYYTAYSVQSTNIKINCPPLPVVWFSFSFPIRHKPETGPPPHLLSRFRPSRSSSLPRPRLRLFALFPSSSLPVRPFINPACPGSLLLCSTSLARL